MGAGLVLGLKLKLEERKFLISRADQSGAIELETVPEILLFKGISRECKYSFNTFQRLFSSVVKGGA